MQSDHMLLTHTSGSQIMGELVGAAIQFRISQAFANLIPQPLPQDEHPLVALQLRDGDPLRHRSGGCCVGFSQMCLYFQSALSLASKINRAQGHAG